MTISKKFSVIVLGIFFLALASFVFSSPATAATIKAPVVKAQATLDNLQAAYDGESNARTRYLAFAKKADQEGYGAAASLFRAAARAEKVHLERHAKVIKQMGAKPKAKIAKVVVGTTKENLESAFKGETYENKTMYPEFLASAEKEGNKEAIDAFEDAGAAEGVHAALYKSALDNLAAWKGPKKDFWVCPLCGNIVSPLSGTQCPICKTPTEKFMPIS